MKDDIMFLAFTIVGLLAIVICFLLLIYGLQTYSCDGYSRATGKPTKLVALDCYIQDGVEWYNWDEYKYRLATKGEFTK